jgi:hypothetical protein
MERTLNVQLGMAEPNGTGKKKSNNSGVRSQNSESRMKYATVKHCGAPCPSVRRASQGRGRRTAPCGDSIVGGHAVAVHELLKDRFCVDCMATSKHVTDVEYMGDLEFMLQRKTSQRRA